MGTLCSLASISKGSAKRKCFCYRLLGRDRVQRQHISKDLIECGFQKAKELGFSFVLVEGNPLNYRSRGFIASKNFGIEASPSAGLPSSECLMIKELKEGALKGKGGLVEYSFYQALRRNG